jgi:hypothetical protein
MMRKGNLNWPLRDTEPCRSARQARWGGFEKILAEWEEIDHSWNGMIFAMSIISDWLVTIGITWYNGITYGIRYGLYGITPPAAK